MSLAIDVDKVDQVLLADGWHRVADKSFDMDAYEFMHDGHAVLSGGAVAGVPSTGAIWTEPGGAIVACPVTAILSVKTATPGAATARERGPRQPIRARTR